MEMMPIQLHLTNQEYAFLTSLLGADYLIGLDDPFKGYLQEELLAEWDIASQSLAEQGLLQRSPDNEIILDQGVSDLLTICAHADVTIALRLATPANEKPDSFYHLNAQAAIGQENKDGKCSLHYLGPPAAIYQELVTVLQLANQQPAPGQECNLSEKVLSEAAQLAQVVKHKAAQNVLKKAGMEIKNAFALESTLSAFQLNGALMAASWRGNSWEIASLGFLDGENGLWCLRTYTQQSQERVCLAPCSAQAAREKIQRWLNRMLPVLLSFEAWQEQ